MTRKLTFAIGLSLGIAGFVAFVGIGVGVWIAKREADRQLASNVEKAHRAGDIASNVIALVRQIISRAKESLAATHAKSLSLPGEIGRAHV